MKKHEEKAKRITKIKNGIDTEYVKRWLPEVEMIEDEEIREKTLWLLVNASPKSFWQKATSSSGKYHPKDERGKYGNILHTKRVYIQYCNLARVDVEMDRLSEYEYDCGKSAALLHDMMKYGWPSDNNQHTQDDHDVIAADVAKYIGGLPPEVYLPIHAHMAKWGEGKEPETLNEWLLHRADKAVAPDWSTIGVYYPAEELTEELNTVGYDSDGRELEE